MIVDDLAVLRTKWYAVVDDLVGGWDVATADKPASQLDAGAGEVTIGCFLSGRLARHIASVHNYHSLQEGRLPDEELRHG